MHMVDFIAYVFPIVLVVLGIVIALAFIGLLGFLVLTAVMRLWMDIQDNQ